MYYRIKNDNVYDYSNDKYDDGCLFSDLCTKEEYQENLGKWIIGDAEEEIDVPDYDEEGNPIMIEYEDTEVVIDYDEEGNPVGSHGITVVKHKQSTHKETITVKKLIENPDWEEIEEDREKERIGNLQITKRVFMLGLQQLGITYTQLKTLIATNEQAQMEWDLCVELQRKNPLLDIMAAQLEVSSVMLDYIFRKANGEDVQPPEEA